MSSMLRSLLVVGLLMAPVIGSAADDKKKHHEDSFTPEMTNDTRIAKEVRHQLVMLPYYSIFDDLGFMVNGSTVTLEGAVVRPVLKSDAENVTKRVEGVTNVINNIEVLPLSPNDDRIRMEMARTIYGSSQLGPRYGNRALPSIHIIVKNGNVTLEGVVANTFDKNFINVRANGVPGVFHVDNNLQVESSK